MRKIFVLLAFMASASLVSAQNQPKTVKATPKKECKKGDKCCSKECKSETASAETGSKSVKKN